MKDIASTNPIVMKAIMWVKQHPPKYDDAMTQGDRNRIFARAVLRRKRMLERKAESQSGK